MSLHAFQKYAATRRLFLALAAPRARETVGHFAAYLQPGERLLDIGAGIGDITSILSERGYTVTALDIDNFSYVPHVTPVIYDGTSMPFGDQHFDTALILTVLHHTADPEAIVREAKRIAHRIIIIEDIYTSAWHKRATFFIDSLLNFEFRGHPHSNKTDAAWRALFHQEKLKVTADKAWGSFGLLRHRMYILEPAASAKPTTRND